MSRVEVLLGTFSVAMESFNAKTYHCSDPTHKTHITITQADQSSLCACHFVDVFIQGLNIAIISKLSN